MENTNDSPSETNAPPETASARQTILSSNLTLFWRVFVPMFGTVFISVLTLAYILTDEDAAYIPFVPTWWAKVLAALLWLGWVLFVYRALWRLHRIDADDMHLYVTNYWTTARYLWADVERVEEKRRLGRRIVNIYLRAPGRFGRKISFLPGTYYNEWMSRHGRG